MKKKDFDILFAISNIWSFAFVIMAVLATLNTFGLTMNHYYSVAYLTALGAYVGGRKTYNKLTKNKHKRNGEVYVVIWAMVWLFAIVAKYFTKDHCVVPEAIPEIAIGVMTIFGIGKASEKLLPKNGNNSKTNNKEAKEG